MQAADVASRREWLSFEDELGLSTPGQWVAAAQSMAKLLGVPPEVAAVAEAEAEAAAAVPKRSHKLIAAGLASTADAEDSCTIDLVVEMRELRSTRRLALLQHWAQLPAAPTVSPAIAAAAAASACGGADADAVDAEGQAT